jgi:hypothetical protein
VVPAWTLLAALAVGVAIGWVASWLVRPRRPAPAESAQPAEPALVEAAPLIEEPPPPPAPPEPVRIGMEDVVSELERRYQGRQADTPSEKRAGSRRRRSPS